MRTGRYQHFAERTPDRPLDCELIAEAVIRAASITGELSVLAYRDEAALKGMVAFKARWLAFAALVALHQEADTVPLGMWLGCGSTAMRSLATMRGQSWWDEGCVYRLFVELARLEGDPPCIASHEATRRAVAGILRDRQPSSPFGSFEDRA